MLSYPAETERANLGISGLSPHSPKMCIRDSFFPYAQGEIFIGARTPATRGHTDITVELSDRSMSVAQQRKVAVDLTPRLAALFGVPPDQLDAINIRFHSYSPTDFAVGGKLLSDMVPRIGQFMKRLFG